MNKTWVSAFGFVILMFTAAAWTAPVPDTGQTKCYGVSGIVITCPSPGQALYGQDANFSINPMSYTKLDGSGKVLPDSATSWVMVRDNVTGLIWENKTDDGTIHDKDNTYTWYDPSDPYPGTPGTGTDSKDFIDALNTANFGGYSNWQLPTIKELGTIVSFSIPYPGPTINNKYFPNTQPSFCWSSTNYAYDMNSAWGVYFGYGDSYGYNKSGYGSIRAVYRQRSDLLSYLDHSAISSEFVDNSDDTVTDTANGLMWQQFSVPSNSWEQALSYCQNLSLSSYTDWRLPTPKELKSVVDDSLYSPSINTTFFPDTFSAFYWSSTTNAYIPDQAWGVNFNYGVSNPNQKGGNYYVRAVRGGQGGSVGNSVLFSNSIGSRNTIKISDMSGTLPASGSAITVSAWDFNGNALPISGGAAPLTLYNYGTTSISGSDLAARFLNGTPILYKCSINSSNVVITNVKNSTNDTFKVPIVYLNGMTNFVSNSIGNYNIVKISDISGLLTSSSTISVKAWDANGNALPESGSAAPLKLYSQGTTSISGSNLAARFPSGSPMIYEFDIPSTKVLVTNVKTSIDGKLNIPVDYTIGVSNFVSNSIGDNNTIKISDLSGTLSSFSGSTISVKAWDANGNALPESGSAAPLKLYSHGTTSISGSNLAARFPAGIPMTYSFSIESSKVLITNVKSSIDGLVEIPSIFTSGISNFTTNYVSPLNTIKISDTSGALPASGVALTITAWDTDGNVVSESGTAAPLKLYNLGTTTIEGTDLHSRFASGSPTIFEFSIGSSSAIVTSLTTSVDGTIKTPTVFTIGSYGGI